MVSFTIKMEKMQRTIRVDTKKINTDKMGSPDWSDLNLENFLSPIFFGEQEKGFQFLQVKAARLTVATVVISYYGIEE